MIPKRSRKAGPLMLLLMGLVFAVAGGCVAWFLGVDTTLTCNRPANTCVIEQSGLAGRTKEVARFPLDQLKSAEISENRTSKGKATWQVVLVTTEDRIPLSNVSTSDRSSHQQNADSINAFLDSSGETLTIFQSGRLLRILGFLFLGIGGLMLLAGAWALVKVLLAVGLAIAARR